jgi:SAM-dependent methyltransferase
MSPFTLPPLDPPDADDVRELSAAMSRLYARCAGSTDAPFGTPYMGWVMDFGALDVRVARAVGEPPERLEGLAFTAHMDAQRRAVAGAFEHRFAGGRCQRSFVGEWVQFGNPQSLLDGNAFERVFPASLAPLIEAAEWDKWGRGVTAPITWHYSEHVYPRVAETLAALRDRDAGRALAVADLGGGGGDLADYLCDAVPAIRTMLVVDRSRELVTQAGRRALMHPERMVVRQGDLADEGFFATLETMDVIVLCGVLAQQVMDRETALRVARRCSERLRPGGLLLAPSYSPSLLVAADYAAMGLRVHNRTLNLFFADPGPGKLAQLRTNDFYVLEKP